MEITSYNHHAKAPFCPAVLVLTKSILSSNRAFALIQSTQARCWLEWGCSRRGFLLRRLQVTLSAAKLGARVGAVHEKARRGGICLCNHRRQDHGTWGLAREDAREGARNHTRGRP